MEVMISIVLIVLLFAIVPLLLIWSVNRLRSRSKRGSRHAVWSELVLGGLLTSTSSGSTK